MVRNLHAHINLVNLLHFFHFIMVSPQFLKRRFYAVEIPGIVPSGISMFKNLRVERVAAKSRECVKVGLAIPLMIKM